VRRGCPRKALFGEVQLKVRLARGQKAYRLASAFVRLESLFSSEECVNVDRNILDFADSAPALGENLPRLELFLLGPFQLQKVELGVLQRVLLLESCSRCLLVVILQDVVQRSRFTIFGP